MGKNIAGARAAQPSDGRRTRDYRALSQEVLRHVNSEVSRADFLRKIAEMILDFSECDAVDLRVRSEDQCLRCEAARRRKRSVGLEVARCRRPGENVLLACAEEGNWLDDVCRTVVEKRFPPASPFLTRGGSFWTGDVDRCLPLVLEPGKQVSRGRGKCRSLMVVPLVAAEETIGLLQLRSNRKDCFGEPDIECYENLAQTLGLALVSQFAQASLRERIKELTCLYRLGQVAEHPGIQLGEILQGIARLLPTAWQYPEIAAARIVFDGLWYGTPGFEKCIDRQSACLVVKDQPRGRIEVGYRREKPVLDEGPFLKEERSLIDTVARQIAVLIERREAAEDRGRLQDQLRHADRLATIGQLSAGVAHELNEPLGNILAFAQLAKKERDVPKQVAQDLDKIVASSLHAREIIKKLMLFARQTPPRKMQVDLNAVVEDGLFLLASRCSKEGVTIERDLAEGLPEIVADPSQLNQVLVNLVVNAIQATPQGGSVRIVTRAAGSRVVLTVEDTGVGMDREVLAKIFTPFFTTKDVHEGTGLGLPVVHGIVTSHGGAISVESKPGEGSRFEIHLPAAGVEEDQGTLEP
jgi:signal transduction histidine kinase/Trp operon repressor